MIKIIAIFALMSVLYMFYVYSGYSEKIRNSNWYWLIGAFMGVFIASTWVWIVKVLDSTKSIFISGMIADFIIAVISLAVPVLLFDLELKPISVLGVVVALIGLFMIKWRLG